MKSPGGGDDIPGRAKHVEREDKGGAPRPVSSGDANATVSLGAFSGYKRGEGMMRRRRLHFPIVVPLPMRRWADAGGAVASVVASVAVSVVVPTLAR